MKINFNFIKKSQLLKQYANQIQSIFILYDKNDYGKAVKIVGSIFNSIMDTLLNIENIKDKNWENFKQMHIYPEAILNDIAIIVHGSKVASNDESITKQDFLTQLTSLHDFLAYIVNVYEDGKVKYWDAQLAYKSNLDKDNLFKPRKVNLPVSDKIIDQELDLNFNSEKINKKSTTFKAKQIDKTSDIEKNKIITKPLVKQVADKQKPKDKTKKHKKSRVFKTIIMISILVIIVGSGFAISQLLNTNTHPKTVVSDTKVSRKINKKKIEKAKKLALQKKKKEEKLKREKARKENWIAGSIYSLNIKTKSISGTINNKIKKRNLALPNPQLNQKVYIVFNPNYMDKKFISITDWKKAKQVVKDQNSFNKLVTKSKNTEYQFNENKLTMNISGLKWNYPMSPYNAIQLSRQGRRKVNNIFARAVTDAKLNKKTGRNTFILTKKLSGKDYSNTSWDNYRANYKIQVSFNKVK